MTSAAVVKELIVDAVASGASLSPLEIRPRVVGLPPVLLYIFDCDIAHFDFLLLYCVLALCRIGIFIRLVVETVPLVSIVQPWKLF